MSALDKSSTAGLTQKGPQLIGVGVALFVLTRIIRWLPLGFVGTWINTLLWPLLLVALVAGGVMMFAKSKRS